MGKKTSIQEGDRIVVTGSHPWNGHSGVVTGVLSAASGKRRRVELDNGWRCGALDTNLRKVGE